MIVAKIWNMPAVSSLPFLGCSVRFLKQKDEDLLSELLNIVESVETPSNAAFLGPLCHIFVANHEDVKVLLTSSDCLDKTYHYRYLFNETNLLVLPGHVWKKHRRLLNPHFTSPVVHTFIPLFNAKIDILVGKMHYSIETNDHDIRHVVHNCFLDMICATTFGVDLNLQEGKHVEFVEAIDNYAKIVARRFFNFYLQVNWIFRWTPVGRLYARSLNVLHGMTKKVVDQHIRDRNSQRENSSEIPSNSTATFMNHLVNLLEEGTFTENNLYDTVEIMILAGFETAAVTMQNILLMLAMHPEAQNHCREEILRICGTSGNISAEEVAQLHYLELVIKETLRLYPVAPLIGRQPTEDIQLKTCTLPRGVHIIIVTYLVHRDPKVWGKDSNAFKPERFLPENFENIPYYSYIPFSAGSRNCIGLKYAMLVMKIVLVKLLREFEFFTSRSLSMDELKCAMYTTIKIAQINELRVRERVK
ncbi:cytochrome P450 4c21-like [Lutzomyia longipalpis]|uniref:cytochrome P450 4c21-like n=1 Tax=Lutzomyia longipalpis TaxID=7200 RepID=UPI002483A38E|nr:cytochrome P450 4c21-like [Lutzomyia longipalpis]